MDSISNEDNRDNGSQDVLAHLPEDLLARISAQVRQEDVRAVAQFDLDDHGRYADGYLVLADGRLGEFTRQDGAWRDTWRAVEDLGESKIVEGLGLSVLRLLADGRVLREFRYTLRHAKPMARLHRQIERQLSDAPADEEADRGRRPDEKKLRCDKCGRVIPPWAESCPACMSRRRILWRLLDYVRPYKGRAIGGFLLGLITTGMWMIIPGLTKPLIDRGLRGGDYNVVLQFVGAMAAIQLFVVVLRIAQGKLTTGLGMRVARDLRNQIYEHLHKLSLSFFARKQTGSLVTRVTSDTDRIWDFVAWVSIDMILSLLTIVGVGVAMLIINWRLALFTLIPIPLLVGVTIFFHKRMHHVFRRWWHKWSQLTAVVAGALPGVRVIKAFSQEKREVSRFHEASDAVFHEEMGFTSFMSVFGPVMMFCSQISGLIIWLLGGWWVVQGEVGIGTLVAFTGYLGMFMRPIHMIAHMDQRLNRAATSAQRVFEVLDTEPTIYSRQGAADPSNLRGKIELRNVTFSYDGVRSVLKGIDLVIEPGQMIGLAGPSGGGKTTLVNLICRFYDVLDGQILIDDVDVRDYDVEKLRRRIGVVLQEPFLFHGTVAENIAYGNPSVTVDQVIRAAKAANAHDFIVGFPDGYDTIVGERGQTLSGGERQRVSIARAILNDPAILILDEATSSVDTETEKLIQEALDRLIANRTTIAIAHRLSTLRKADRLVILENGEKMEEGTHEDLAGLEDGIYAKLLRMQNEMQSVMAI